MAHSIPSPITLNYRNNKIIRIGMSQTRKLGDKIPEGARISKQGEALAKPIHLYRMWFRFLSLALELEEQGVSIITNHVKVDLPKPTKDVHGHVRRSRFDAVSRNVVINRQMYADWDIESIPESTFDNWWIKHRDLFIETPLQVLTSKREWIDNVNLLHLQIDKRRRVEDTIAEVRRVLQGFEQEEASTTNYPINGLPRVDTLINRYNALILKLTTDKTDKEILGMKDVFRVTKEGMGKQNNGKYWTDQGTQTGRVMRDLIRPAIITLLSVADGYFVTNPNEEYVAK